MYPTCENVDLALKRAEAIVENLITGEAQVHAREAVAILAATIKKPIEYVPLREIPSRDLEGLTPEQALQMTRSILPIILASSLTGKPLPVEFSVILARVFGLSQSDLAQDVVRWMRT